VTKSDCTVNCKAESENIAAFRLNDGTAANSLVNPLAVRSVYGINIRTAAYKNRIVGARVSTTYNQGILLEGHDNVVAGAQIDTDRVFGLFISGTDATSNTISGVTVTSSFGESCVQVSNDASYNF